MITAIVTICLLVYTNLEKYVFGPSRKKGSQQSVFNFTDFPRHKDKYNRMPQSIFSDLLGKTITGDDWWDRAVSYLGDKGELLHNMVDDGKNFNVNNLFELYAFLCYWVDTATANNIFFNQIMNPMFNVGLITDTGAMTNNRFTAYGIRWFWLYDDYLRLNAIANSPDHKFSLVLYTHKRTKSANVDAKPYAISLLAVLQNYPFTSGYFIDGLTNPDEIMNREVIICADYITPVEPTSNNGINGNNSNNSNTGNNDNIKISSQSTKSTASTIIEKVLIGLAVSAILIFIFKLFEHFKNKNS